jgi:hypothetical protein
MAAMPPHAFVANVGRAVEEARFTIASPARTRELLAGLASIGSRVAHSGREAVQ